MTKIGVSECSRGWRGGVRLAARRPRLRRAWFDVSLL